MDTPVCDFVRKYAKTNAVRLHMPGHKGNLFLGIEHLDITEIGGADSLYDADGIIKASEDNASELFGCKTLYSTEGSSQCIRAMLYLAVMYAKQQNRKPKILAGRNAHKTFLSAAALLDFETEWIYPQKDESYLSCRINAEILEDCLSSSKEKPTAIYITNPDYLGNCVNIKSIADVCHKYGILLLVDNAHGAYLRFLPESLHPIDLGADICCDSAHKTLPVLTGGAYLHISDNTSELLKEQAKNALAMFGSTSPSYIIMQSLDEVNRYISEGFAEKLASFISAVSILKKELTEFGYSFIGDEPLKLTFDVKEYGYTGFEFSEILQNKSIVCEFSDPDYVVMMFTPETGEDNLMCLKNILVSIPRKEKIKKKAPDFYAAEKVLSVREAAFSACEAIPVSESIGRILAAASVGCPPAVPIVMCGERIDSHAVECFEYYGIKYCTVIK